MKVRYLGAMVSACDMYRAGIPFASLRSKGHDVEFLGEELQRAADSNGDFEIECDVLIVPRPISEFAYDMVVSAKQAGIAAVVEVDDEFDAVHAKNRSYDNINKGLQWFKRSIEACDLMTVSTQRLQSLYAPEKTVVVPNSVPDQIFEVPLSDEKWGIGWTGSLSVHPDDLQVVGDALRKMSRKGVKFRHVGTGDLTDIIKTNYIAYGFAEYGQYFHVVNDWAVGIVPLAPTNFNDSKSFLKGIEYAAMGVPFVASPTVEYKYLNAVHGIGVLANSPYEWYTGLRRLLRSDDALQEMSIEYRQVAYDQFRQSINDWRWLEAWSEAIKRTKNARV